MVQSAWRPSNLYPKLIGKAKVISFDIETYDPNLTKKGPGTIRKDGYICGFSVATNDGYSDYFPIKHEGGDNVKNPDKAILWLKKQLSDNTPKIGANITYDCEWIRSNFGFKVKGLKQDIQIAEALIDENRLRYSLDVIAEKYLGERKKEALLIAAGEDVLNSKIKDEKKLLGFVKGNLWKLPSRYVGPYAIADAELPFKIFQKQKKILDKEELNLVFEMETKLIDLLIDMKFQGVRINYKKAERTFETLQLKYDDAMLELKHRCGWKPNVYASADIAKACKKLDLPFPMTPHKTDPKPSFTAPWLVIQKHPFFVALLKARRLDRISKTYLQKTILNGSIKGRLHATFKSTKREDGTGTVSGRFSCSNPNLENVPKRNKELAPLIRSLFIPEKGMKWMVADYCFSSDTEILTKEGWVFFPELRGNMLIANVDPNSKELTYDKPLGYQKKWFKGKLVNIVGKKHCDLLVTPSHWCLQYKARSLKPVFKTPMRYSKNDMQLHAGKYTGSCSWMQSYTVIILAAIQADSAYRGNYFRFYLKKKRKIKRLLKALNESPLWYSLKSVIPSKPGYTCINIRCDEVKYLLGDYVTLNKEKNFTKKILEFSTIWARRFVAELGKWDGSYQNKTNWYYASTNLNNIETISQMAVQADLRTNITYPKIIGNRKKMGVVNISKRSMTYCKTFQKIKVLYNDWVYCVTMPKSTVVVRRKGKIMVTGQSQQEPRVTVHYAVAMGYRGSAEAQRRYTEDENADYHQMVADMAGIDRPQAKILNLGMAYGMGKPKLAASLDMPFDDAMKIYEQYHKAVPYVKLLGRLCQNKARDRGYVKTILGRRRHFDLWQPPYDPDVRFKPLPREQAFEKYGARIERAFTNKAFNSIIQGSSADMIKKAMLNCYDLGYVPCNTVHDELDFSISNQKQAKEIKDVMENCIKLHVPIKADIEIGPSWGEVKPVDL